MCVPWVCFQTPRKTAAGWGRRGSWYRSDTPPWISPVSSQSPPCQTHSRTISSAQRRSQFLRHLNAIIKTTAVFAWGTCAVQKRDCSGWAGRGPWGAWCPSRWPSAGSPGSCLPCRWPELSSTGICSHFWYRESKRIRILTVVLTTEKQVRNGHVLADFVVEVCNALVGPVFAQRGQDVTQRIRPVEKHETCEHELCLFLIIPILLTLLLVIMSVTLLLLLYCYYIKIVIIIIIQI